MTSILYFLNKWTTLHHTVEIIYVVDGYEITVLKDDSAFKGPFCGKSIEECFQVALEELK